MIIEASINHVEEHYNPRCRATIPSVWQVTCENLADLLGENWEPEFDGFGSVCNGGSHRALYAIGGNREEAIELFKGTARSMFPNGGRIRFI